MQSGLVSRDFDLEKFIDGFIYHSGGYRVSDLCDLPKDEPPQNADYYFPNENVIIELKILEKDVVESRREKLDQAKREWFKEIKITGKMILGLETEDTTGLDQRISNILRRPLEQISSNANKQVRHTKTLLNELKAYGVVLFLNDGSFSLDSFTTIKLLTDPIERHFSSINGFVYFTFRRRAFLPNETDFGYLIWQAQMPNCPDFLAEFVDNLGTRWFRYLELLSGKRFGNSIRSDNDYNYLRQLRF